MKHFVLIFILSLVLLSCSQELESYEDNFIFDHSQGIMHGEADDSVEHQAVVSLVIKIQEDVDVFCSGTLITPKYVLTAAHCVSGALKSGGAYWRYVYIGIGKSARDADRYIKAKQAWVKDGYVFTKDGVGGLDIAVIELEEAVESSLALPIAPLPPTLSFTRESIKKGEVQVEFVGYGRRESGDSGLRYRAEGTVSAMCGNSDDRELGCKTNFGGISVDFPWGSLFFSMRYKGTCSGDSGGPAFYIHDGVKYVAGVTSYGDQDCMYYGVSTRVSDYYDFIVSKVGGNFSDIAKEICDNGKDDNGNELVDCDDAYCTRVFAKCKNEICDNGIDDNENGFFDCNDPACEGELRCYFEDCHNFKDDNDDGLVDCADPICGESPYCKKEICDNNLDDNKNGLIDCQDLSCKSFVKCKLEDCSNKIDDNDNGLVDCDDPQCSQKSVCQIEICDNKIDDNYNGFIDCHDSYCKSHRACVVKEEEKQDKDKENNDKDRAKESKEGSGCQVAMVGEADFGLWNYVFLGLMGIYGVLRRGSAKNVLA